MKSKYAVVVFLGLTSLVGCQEVFRLVEPNWREIQDDFGKPYSYRDGQIEEYVPKVILEVFGVSLNRAYSHLKYQTAPQPQWRACLFGEKGEEAFPEVFGRSEKLLRSLKYEPNLQAEPVATLSALEWAVSKYTAVAHFYRFPDRAGNLIAIEMEHIGKQNAFVCWVAVPDPRQRISF
jgi:hypothetical protein